MPHSTFKQIPTVLDAGVMKCQCGRTFNYELERERKTKIRLHKKFCDKLPSNPSFAPPQRKAMTAKELQRLWTERREFHA